MTTPAPNPERMPGVLRIIAWLWIVAGGLMALSGFMALLALSAMPQMPEPPPEFGLMALPFRHIGVLMAAQFVVAVIALVAGIGLLRLRAWARTTVEVMCWLAIAYNLVFVVLWVSAWTSIAAPMMDTMPDGGGWAMRYAGPVMAIVMTAAMTVPLVLMIRYLRGPEARAAVVRGGG